MKPPSFNFKTFQQRLTMTAALCAFTSGAAMAASPQIPGNADVNRVQPKQRLLETPSSAKAIEVLTAPPDAPIPPAAKTIHFVLNELQITGATAFSAEELKAPYHDLIGQNVSLEQIYKLAAAITQKYRQAGFFLSRAYVANQRIRNGVIRILVAEGAIGEVEIQGEVHKNDLIQSYVDRLKADKPLSSALLESILLRMNDIAGVSLRAVLSPLETREKNTLEQGLVKLTLVASPTTITGAVGFDNFGSRYLGPNEAFAVVSNSFWPGEKVTVTGLTSFPTHELNQGVIDHAWQFAPDWTWSIGGGITHANPGYTLDNLDIDSNSVSFNTALTYQWIRQRRENLALKFSFDTRDTHSDFFSNTPLTRDRIRVLHANAAYDLTDQYRGFNTANFTVSQGINALSASKKGAPNLSRAEAEPDFTKAELALSRLQRVDEAWDVLASAAGQVASGPLYSSEELGYGGQQFGRAYDLSELTGDHGFEAGLELRYTGWWDLQPVNAMPYMFIDYGVVWNDDAAQRSREDAASIGIGVRGRTEWGVSGNVGLAWPLTRDVSTPIYGASKQGPRVILQIVKQF